MPDCEYLTYQYLGDISKFVNISYSVQTANMQVKDVTINFILLTNAQFYRKLMC